MPDEGTPLGRMFAATQKVAGLEQELYGEGGTKDDPKGGVVTDVQNLKNWAATDPSKPYNPNETYDPATTTAPSVGDTTPPAPADTKTAKPPKDVREDTNPPAAKQGFLPFGFPQTESAALIIMVGMIGYGLI